MCLSSFLFSADLASGRETLERTQTEISGGDNVVSMEEDMDYDVDADSNDNAHIDRADNSNSPTQVSGASTWYSNLQCDASAMDRFIRITPRPFTAWNGSVAVSHRRLKTFQAPTFYCFA